MVRPSSLATRLASGATSDGGTIAARLPASCVLAGAGGASGGSGLISSGAMAAARAALTGSLRGSGCGSNWLRSALITDGMRGSAGSACRDAAFEAPLAPSPSGTATDAPWAESVPEVRLSSLSASSMAARAASVGSTTFFVLDMSSAFFTPHHRARTWESTRLPCLR